MRIKLTGNKEDRAHAFYIMITNGNTCSVALNEFVISEQIVELIQKEGCSFEVIK